jgi:antibiotic biosynthesis monooxygenase (ABM) superfamily enzyme
MEPAAPNLARPNLDVHGARASTVITQVIPASAREAFLEWQRGFCAAAAEAPGYQTTEIYPPADGQEPWVIVVHFDDHETLSAWLDSPKRAEWIARKPSEIPDFRLKTLPSGFAAWFVGTIEGSAVPLPPKWKMALTVLIMLYPTVMLLSIYVSPHIHSLGLAWSILASNILSVAILQWIVQPALDPVLGPWLRANEESQKAYSVLGLATLLFLLGGMALAFHFLAG